MCYFVKNTSGLPRRLIKGLTTLQMVGPYESFDCPADKLPDGTEHPSYATTFWHKASHTSGPWESISGCQRLAADGAEWLLVSGPCCRSHKINLNSRTRIYVPYTSHPCGHSWECPPRFCNPLCRSGLPRKHRHICNNHCCIMMNARVSMGCWL